MRAPLWPVTLLSLLQMVGAWALSVLLLLPLLTCSPVLNREPGGALAGRKAGACAAGGLCVPGGTARWPRAARAPALLVVARELLGLEQASLGGPLARREDSGEAPDSLPADGKKARGSLGTLVEELQGYGRKKGGFSFRFGRG